MHELGLIQAAMEEIARVARANNIRRIVKVKLVVGKLNGALPDALQFAFKVMAPETIFEGAVLEIEEVDIRLRCPACGHETVVDEITYWCPACGTRAEILAGKDLYIDYFEGDEEEGVEQ
ncbi:hydrogenase maturation nickel metallochaperone HypA/HybF [Desulfofundulus thermosubterraneus]|uniref:Hydrogenase maturation factor HypA n=1 Tax=Desulfofundulus thermosubterraneus DSM 16057 TaxID=1121432 RepID=A0A1M6FBL0_9FIRM|nr:hydrogenase maturation nickel metallochaperone HypA [Desulfofundulus thermosubterraneus]SHI95053.1 hydrogenase nickel incorporation protein HypA/HybF [Desulfofundulus thermosubterraneus DSM 16057]